MGKTKIGVLIFTHKVKERALSNDTFDNKKYFGLKAILNELDKNKYEIEYISSYSINKCDFVLIPIISYYDAMAYINEIYGNRYDAKLIVGGPYVLNYHTFSNAYAIVIGRCEDMINAIFDKHDYSNVIYPSSLKQEYEVGDVKRFLCVGQRNEVAVGCAAKCYFCQYAWKNKYTSLRQEGYNSSYSDYEDYIQNLKAEKNGRYVTAIDGLTEYSRLKVNKKITNDDICNKLNEIVNNDIAGLLKIYNIIAYPWESKVNFEELIESVNKCDRQNKNKLTIYLTHTHFVPKLQTPMEDFKVNMMDARKYVVNQPIIFRGKYFKVANNISVTSNVSAIEEYIIDRADNESDINKIKRIICSTKYASLANRIKNNVIKQHFEKYTQGYKGDYKIKNKHNISGIKNKLYFADS